MDYGGRAGGGLQMVVEDIDRDGDRDIVTAGKTGLFLSESLLKAPARRRSPSQTVRAAYRSRHACRKEE